VSFELISTVAAVVAIVGQFIGVVAIGARIQEQVRQLSRELDAVRYDVREIRAQCFQFIENSGEHRRPQNVF